MRFQFKYRPITPLSLACYLVIIPTICAHLSLFLADNSHLATLGERSRFHPQSVATKVVLFSFFLVRLTTIAHSTEKFLIGHTTSIVQDTHVDIIRIGRKQQLDIGTSCTNTIVHYIGNSIRERVTHVAHRAHEEFRFGRIGFSFHGYLIRLG